MKVLKLNEVYKILNVSPDYNDDIEIINMTNDITKINNNTLVFHLKKDVELDIDQFNKLSNCYIVTDQPILNHYNVSLRCFIFVLDVHKAYQQFINYYRDLFKIPIVAITGTCGKTTTKEMIKQVIEKDYKISSTISNINNLGVNNDYLLSIDEDTNYGVFETAISYPGNLIEGCSYFKPTIGVITNIGIDHLNAVNQLIIIFVQKEKCLLD